MKRNLRDSCFLLAFPLLIAMGLAGCRDAAKTDECPAEGRAKPGSSRNLTEKEKKLNEGKNRDVANIPTGTATLLDLARILHAPPHWEAEDYTAGDYVSANCYIVKYTEEGPESCNCYEAEKEDKDGDVHIYISDNPDATNDECMVAEITPAFKKLHPDYNRMLRVGEPISITGFLLYDYMHEKNSKNGCVHCENQVWRKTCWEIHPVTVIH